MQIHIHTPRIQRPLAMLDALAVITVVIALACGSAPAHAQVSHTYAAEDLPNQFTAINSFQQGLYFGSGLTYAQIIALPFPFPGTILLCTNCTFPSNPCSLSSNPSQAYAVYLNGSWNCNLGGTGGGGSGVSSYAGGTGGPRTGAVVYQSTDPGVLGIQQVGNGTLGILTNNLGTLSLGSNFNHITLYSSNASGCGVFIEDGASDTICGNQTSPFGWVLTVNSNLGTYPVFTLNTTDFLMTLNGSTLLDANANGINAPQGFQSGQSQFFPSEFVNGQLIPDMHIGFAFSTGSPQTPPGSVWLSSLGQFGYQEMEFEDAGGLYTHSELNEQSTPYQMSNSATGSGQTVLSVGAQQQSGTIGTCNYNATTGGFLCSPSSFDMRTYYYNPLSLPSGFSASCLDATSVGTQNYVGDCFDTANNGQIDLIEQEQPPLPYARIAGKSTATMAAGALAAGACATVVTVASTNILTSDVIAWNYAANPTSATDALLDIEAYPTAGNANFKRCNKTANSITGTAIVINWNVPR